MPRSMAKCNFLSNSPTCITQTGDYEDLNESNLNKVCRGSARVHLCPHVSLVSPIFHIKCYTAWQQRVLREQM